MSAPFLSTAQPSRLALLPRRPRLRSSLAAGLACCLGAGLAYHLPSAGAAPQAETAAPALTVAWRNKPPLHYMENGEEKGILLLRARQVFATAGLTTHFVEEPAKRIWNNFTIGTRNYCSFGWYRIPEREPLVQFSTVFHSDPPHTLLVSPEAVAQVQAHKTLESLLSDPTLTLGVVDGVSYGPELDALIKRSHNMIARSTVAPMVMARMVAGHRASFMLIDRDDWEYLKDKEDGVQSLKQMDLREMPAGLNRYIVCSKDVPQAVMQRIDKAIAKVLALENPK
jgi:uncharacterized protein (TIGR02285 family)